MMKSVTYDLIWCQTLCRVIKCWFWTNKEIVYVKAWFTFQCLKIYVNLLLLKAPVNLNLGKSSTLVCIRLRCNAVNLGCKHQFFLFLWSLPFISNVLNNTRPFYQLITFWSYRINELCFPIQNHKSNNLIRWKLWLQ